MINFVDKFKIRPKHKSLEKKIKERRLSRRNPFLFSKMGYRTNKSGKKENPWVIYSFFNNI